MRGWFATHRKLVEDGVGWNPAQASPFNSFGANEAELVAKTSKNLTSRFAELGVKRARLATTSLRSRIPRSEKNGSPD